MEREAHVSELIEFKKSMENILAKKPSYVQIEELQALLEARLEDKAAISEVRELQELVEMRIDKDTKSIQIEDHVEITPEDYLNHATEVLRENHRNIDNVDRMRLYSSLFQNAFYDHAVVAEKQRIYLPYIQRNSNHKWLDIGCGRGEFIENLRNEKIRAVGVDVNPIEIDKLRNSGFEVHCSDAIDFLKKTKETYLGISALQVTEHFDKDYLNTFIQLSCDRIKDDGLIILETINPHNPIAFGNFYIDSTHKSPLPSELMVFLLQWYGFKNIKIVYSFPLPEKLRGPYLERNYHDYAVIGYKNKAYVHSF